MANLLANPNFGAAPNPPTLLIGTGHPGNSAAPHWTTWNNSGPPNHCAYTSTAVIKLSTVDRLVATIDSPDPEKNQSYCYGIHDFFRRPPINHPLKEEQVIEVCTNGDGNGIVQVFAADPNGPQHTRSSVWVFVLRGQVCMGTGHGGNTGRDAKSTKTYEWEQLHAPNGVSPATEFIVYSASGDGAWYFVADASVIAI